MSMLLSLCWLLVGATLSTWYAALPAHNCSRQPWDQLCCEGSPKGGLSSPSLWRQYAVEGSLSLQCSGAKVAL